MKEILTALDSNDIIRGSPIAVGNTTSSTMVRDGLIVWTVDDMRLASRALEPTHCIRNAHRTRSIRAAVR